MNGGDERYEITRHHELMLRIARRPRFCCGCLCIPRDDRRRARRVFRLTRRIVRAWEEERRQQDHVPA